MFSRLCVRDLKVELGGRTVLHGVTMRVPDEGCTVIMGGSGSGKSVLLKTILGFYPPLSGEIEINNMLTPADVSVNCVRNNIGVVFQNVALIDDLCVWENVAFRLVYQYRVTVHSAKARALNKLAELGIGPEHCNKYPSELSGGMARRVAIARVLVTDPNIIIMDEPTAGLDPISSKIISNIVQQDLANRTLLIVTHDVSLCCSIATEVIFLKDGNIICHCQRDEVFTVENDYVRQFMS